VQIDHYLLIEAARLEILAEVAAAKGHAGLANEIRRCRRILIDAAPLKPADTTPSDSPDDGVRGSPL
jgi:hypothetical protein